jgi:hypothetical protein
MTTTDKFKIVECECEHASHFPEEKKLSPNGNPNHKYGQGYCAHYMVTVQTPFGKFTVCRECADDCYAQFEKIEG